MLENTGDAQTSIALPSPEQAAVVVFDAAGREPLCRKEAEPAPPGLPLVELAERERRALVVRLESCHLAPGAYRYEAAYVIPDVPGARWAGRLGPEHGRIVVQRSTAVIDRPASRAAVSPPGPGGTGSGRTPEPDVEVTPAPANPHLRPGVSPLGPSSLSCVDRELARRGMNAWGDPAATIYPEGPPTLSSDVERQMMILERYPDIATLCRVPP
jgi:hypothetical protein